MTLADQLKIKIAHEGPLPFVDYMTACLFDPQLGYYTQLQSIGRAGDFVTAPELGPYLADALAHAMQPILGEMDRPVVLELGAGTGRLAYDLLLKLEQLNCLPEAYVIKEFSPALRAIQAQTISSLPPHLKKRVTWLETLPTQKWVGILLANEVFDALPVERFIQTKQGLKRLGVDWVGDQLAEVILEQDLDFERSGVFLPEGYRSEFCPGLVTFLAPILAAFSSAVGFVIDYGYPREVYYAPYRNQGTLQAYYQHQTVSPFLNPGQCDLTAHVDFTALAYALQKYAWQVDFLKPQNLFLLEQNLLQRYSLCAEHYALNRLLDPRLMGEVFKVMQVRFNFQTESI